MTIEGLYAHWSQVPWDESRWPNFAPNEPNLACPCCGEFYVDLWMLNALQGLRSSLGQGIRINSGHRCQLSNFRVGGAAKSQHLRVAWDISLYGQSPNELYARAIDQGFDSFGFYGTFLHVDARRGPRWFTKEGKKTWAFLQT